MEEECGLDELYSAWPEDQVGLKNAFKELAEEARIRSCLDQTLVSRPGISYSFRAIPNIETNRGGRPVSFLVDVVVSSADPWFLSVCFYEDEITDPEEEGNAIPQGLFGETGYCFDVDDYDEALLTYIKPRIAEAERALYV